MRKNTRIGAFTGTAVFALMAFISCSWMHTPGLKSVLKKTYDLSPVYNAGDTDFYHINTAYREMDDSGRVAKVTVLDGFYSREVRKPAPHQRADRFTWKLVKMGEGKSPEGIQAYTVLPFASGFQYEFTEWAPEKFPVDTATIPRTMDGWRFYVKLLDAHTFDVIGNVSHFGKQGLSIGDETVIIEDPFPVSMDFPPLYTDTYFVNSPFHISLQGMTLYSDEPCAILAFRSDDCRVRLVAHTNNMTMPSDGVSYYWGDVYVSVDKGRITRGKIMERVDLVITLPSPMKPLKHTTLREIHLERISEKEFMSITPKTVSLDHPF